MKECLDGLEKNECEKQKDIFIKILCDSTFSRREVIDLLDISVSNDKWKRIRNGNSQKPRGNKALDINLPNIIKKWCEIVEGW